MTFKELKLKIKKEQKDRAVKIRILKAARKPHVYNSNPELYDSLGHLENIQDRYRHTHIQYCMFFNRTEYEDIERTTNKYLSQYTLDTLKDAWTDIVEEGKDEALRTSA